MEQSINKILGSQTTSKTLKKEKWIYNKCNLKLKKSYYLKCIKLKNKYLLYNSLFGNPYVVDSQTYDFLNIFSHPIPIVPLLQSDQGSMAQLIKQLLCDHILVVSESNERELLAKRKATYLERMEAALPVSKMTLIVTENCNFDCVYCFRKALYLPSLSCGSNRTHNMSFHTARRAIEVLVASARKRGINKLKIGFNGGEPLLNWNLVERILYFFRNGFAPDFSVDWGLNTNASLVTPQIAKVLREFDVRVNTSMDGNAAANDKVRVKSSGKDTYNDILQGIRTLISHKVMVTGIYVVIAQENIDEIDSSFFNAVRSLKISVVSLELDYTRPYPIDVQEMVNRIINLKRLGFQHGIRVTGSWERPFREMISVHDHAQRDFYCAAVSGQGAAIAQSGAILACSGLPKVFGTIWKPQALMIPSKGLLALVRSRHTGEISECIGCEIEGLCKGGCLLVNTCTQAANNPRLYHQKCNLLKQVTNRLLTDWLSKGRSPSEDEPK